jgi:hypothetical protein
LLHTTTAAFTFLANNLPPIPGQPLTLYVPGVQLVTVGTALNFVVYARNPIVPTAVVKLAATGLAPNMAFNPTSGTFSFTPAPNQAGQSFVVNFTATDPTNSAASSSRSVAIHVANSASQPSGGGFCLNCLIPRGLSLTMWLFVIGGLIGVTASIAILNIKARSELVGVRRRHHNAARITQHRTVESHSEKLRATMENRRRNPIRNYEDN